MITQKPQALLMGLRLFSFFDLCVDAAPKRLEAARVIVWASYASSYVIMRAKKNEEGTTMRKQMKGFMH